LKIVVFSSSRADSGILGPLIAYLDQRKDLDLRVLATGTHLKSKFGRTLKREFEFLGKSKIDRVRIGDFGDRPSRTGVSLGRALGSFSLYLSRKQPDLVVVLGDRMETLVFALASSIANIPIAHLHGGEITTGALDETHRHAISKLSALHFTIDLESKKRLEAMGENPNKVFAFGSPRYDYLRGFTPKSKSQIENALGVSMPSKFALVTIHPAMHDQPSTAEHVKALLIALEEQQDLFVLFTGTNSDPGSDEIRELVKSYVTNHSSTSHYEESLGSDLYISCLMECSVAIGNSSSLVLEAKPLGTPTVLLGKRQLGRATAEECLGPEAAIISHAIDRAVREKEKIRTISTLDSVSERISEVLFDSHPISTLKVFNENT
jgi:UDP-hydrolysing UDP-N-acetyl-D-glucosamine 2-epimerase